jgi:nucleoside permease NupC
MAAAQGAQTGVKLAVAVGAMVLAFVALVALANGLLGGVGGWFGYPDLSFQQIVGWIFQPIMFLIGVPWNEAGVAGGLFGTKIVLNEFVAFIDLGALQARADQRAQPRDRHLRAVRLRQFQLDRDPDGGDRRPRAQPAAGDRQGSASRR